jgi:hypothetical protein
MVAHLQYQLNGEQTHRRCVGICYPHGKDISAEMVCREDSDGRSIEWHVRAFLCSFIRIGLQWLAMAYIPSPARL